MHVNSLSLLLQLLSKKVAPFSQQSMAFSVPLAAAISFETQDRQLSWKGLGIIVLTHI